MHLITMAHLGEAQGVIDAFNLIKKSPELYEGSEIILLLTGEGPFEAATRTAFHLSKYPIQKIINLGIAGSINDELIMGEIYPIRSIYLIQDLKPAFKTFNAFDTGIDCLTSFERILDPEKARKLKGLGGLVDRELWGVAMAAKTAGIKIESFKLISDVAGTIEACEVIKDQAFVYSMKLAQHLKTKLQVLEEVKKSSTRLEGFHFTFTTQSKFETLLNKLSIKEEKPKEEIIHSLPLNKLLDLKITPKERTRMLLEMMDDRIDPVKKALNTKKEHWIKSFIDLGFKVQTDPLWESSNVTVSFEIKNDEELLERIEHLKTLSVKPYEELLNGNLYVE
jgi:hypothetical protein